MDVADLLSLQLLRRNRDRDVCLGYLLAHRVAVTVLMVAALAMDSDDRGLIMFPRGTAIGLDRDDPWLEWHWQRR